MVLRFYDANLRHEMLLLASKLMIIRDFDDVTYPLIYF